LILAEVAIRTALVLAVVRCSYGKKTVGHLQEPLCCQDLTPFHSLIARLENNEDA
jgi:hypothetical protein